MNALLAMTKFSSPIHAYFKNIQYIIKVSMVVLVYSKMVPVATDTNTLVRLKHTIKTTIN